MGERRRRNPSAHTAMAGPVISRASMGAASSTPISAPENPCARNHNPAKGRLTPLAPKSNTYCSAMRRDGVIAHPIADGDRSVG